MKESCGLDMCVGAPFPLTFLNASLNHPPLRYLKGPTNAIWRKLKRILKAPPLKED